MSYAIYNWTAWIVDIWRFFVSNTLFSIPLLMVAFSIILIMFDKIKGLIK